MYSCFHGEPVSEWLVICRALVEFVCMTSKCWYESLNINNPKENTYLKADNDIFY